MFGMVCAAGVKILAGVDFTQRGNLFIVGVSIVLGLITTLAPAFYNQMHATLDPIAHSGIVMAAVSAFVLNLYFTHFSLEPRRIGLRKPVQRDQGMKRAESPNENDMNNSIRFQPVLSLFCGDIDAQIRFTPRSSAGPMSIRRPRRSIAPLPRTAPVSPSTVARPRRCWVFPGVRRDSDREIGSLLTFVIADHERDIARQVVDLGGAILKPPFATYYGHWQVVFQDPDGNIARISAASFPSDAITPELASEGT